MEIVMDCYICLKVEQGEDPHDAADRLRNILKDAGLNYNEFMMVLRDENGKDVDVL